VLGFAAFVLAALGLVLGVLLVGGILVVTALASRRRRGAASGYAARMGRFSGGRDPLGNCVELDRDSYTVRIVDDKKPPA